jgi:hypothetical protein
MIAAAVLAAAWSFLSVAFADSATLGDNPHWLFFGGGDLWHKGGFAHGGILWSPNGLNSEGFTLKLLLAGGTYYYDAGATNITGRQRLVSLLPGWRIKQGRFEILFVAGPELQQHDLGPDDPGNALNGTHLAVRFGGDLWFEPLDSLMVAGAVSVSSLTWQYWTRAQLGVRIPILGWIGPEFHALGDASYVQRRYGIHITGLRTLMVEWSLGAGYLSDTADRAGAYGRIGLNVRR